MRIFCLPHISNSSSSLLDPPTFFSGPNIYITSEDNTIISNSEQNLAINDIFQDKRRDSSATITHSAENMSINGDAINNKDFDS